MTTQRRASAFLPANRYSGVAPSCPIWAFLPLLLRLRSYQACPGCFLVLIFYYVACYRAAQETASSSIFIFGRWGLYRLKCCVPRLVVRKGKCVSEMHGNLTVQAELWAHLRITTGPAQGLQWPKGSYSLTFKVNHCSAKVAVKTILNLRSLKNVKERILLF